MKIGIYSGAGQIERGFGGLNGFSRILLEKSVRIRRISVIRVLSDVHLNSH